MNSIDARNNHKIEITISAMANAMNFFSFLRTAIINATTETQKEGIEAKKSKPIPITPKNRYKPERSNGNSRTLASPSEKKHSPKRITGIKQRVLTVFIKTIVHRKSFFCRQNNRLSSAEERY